MIRKILRLCYSRVNPKMIHKFGTQYWVQIAVSYYITACNQWKKTNLYFIALEKQTNIKTCVLSGPGKKKSHLVLHILKRFTTEHYIFPDFKFCIQIRLHWKERKEKWRDKGEVNSFPFASLPDPVSRAGCNCTDSFVDIASASIPFILNLTLK